MIYARILFDSDELTLIEELLQPASLVAAQNMEEARFYQGACSALQLMVERIRGNLGESSFSEEQLKMLKGLLSWSFTEFRVNYQKAFENKLPVLEDMRRQWVIRDRLSKKLDAPFIADTSSDAEEEPSDDECK